MALRTEGGVKDLVYVIKPVPFLLVRYVLLMLSMVDA